MIGWFGSAPVFEVRNFTGTPVAFWSQRRVNAIELSHGSETPRRRLTAFLSELSFLNWPLDSRWEIEPE